MLPLVIDGELSHCVNVRSIVFVDDSYVSYQWSTGDEGYYTMTSDSSCSVMVTDANGCTGTDTVDFVILPFPGPLPISHQYVIFSKTRDGAHCRMNSVLLVMPMI